MLASYKSFAALFSLALLVVELLVSAATTLEAVVKPTSYVSTNSN